MSDPSDNDGNEKTSGGGGGASAGGELHDTADWQDTEAGTQGDTEAQDADLDSVGLRIREKLFGSDGTPRTIDRFKLGRKLGAGGMGTVYEAWDEKLQRHVALKFLRGPSSSERGRIRFYREAQGLARISHPNVIAVYDVGQWQDRVWIAMEFVPGQTLGDWASSKERSQADILAKWIEAGRGLAAIHDAGMTHRDIKPQNVLLGDDGRVRVIDLGLVKPNDTIDDLSDSTNRPVVDSTIDDSGANRRAGLTEFGSFVGTPGYAAPEHWERRWVDARSDQYSYCVVLWEALCGHRPSRTERGRNGLVPLPEGVRMPKGLHRALSRGLALEPSKRFPSMHELLAALAPRQRKWVSPTVAASTTAVFGGALVWLLTPPTVVVDDHCADADAEIHSVWTDERRQLVEQDIGAKALQRVDEWVVSWSRAAVDSCEEVHVQQRFEQLFERRGNCLASSLEGFATFAHAVEEHRVRTVSDVNRWFEAFESPAWCQSEAATRRLLSSTATADAEELGALRRRLLELDVKEGGSLGERIAEVLELRERAVELGDASLDAEASMLIGRLRTIRYEVDAARAEFGRVLDRAFYLQDVDLGSRAWTQLFGIEYIITGDRARMAWTLERHAALFEGADPGPRARARMLNDRVDLLIAESRLEEAEAVLDEVQATLDLEGLSGASLQVRAVYQRGWLMQLLGRSREAIAAYQRAHELELGYAKQPIHSTGMRLVGEVVALIEAGQFEEARELATRGLEHARLEQGSHGELVVRAHVVLAAACEGLGDSACTRENYEQADRISLIAMGPNNPVRIDVLAGIGIIAYTDRRFAAAVVAFEQALVLARTNFPADSIEVADAELNLATAVREEGKLDRAAMLARQALVTFERRLPDGHPSQLMAMIVTAEIEIGRGSRDAARELLERAAEIAAPDAPERARIDELLASIDQSTDHSKGTDRNGERDDIDL